MNNIRPVSDLRNNFAEISRILHDENKPVVLTKNGYADMVVLSPEAYEKLLLESEFLIPNLDPTCYYEFRNGKPRKITEDELVETLIKSMADIDAGNTIDADEVFADIRKRMENKRANNV